MRVLTTEERERVIDELADALIGNMDLMDLTEFAKDLFIERIKNESDGDLVYERVEQGAGWDMGYTLDIPEHALLNWPASLFAQRGPEEFPFDDIYIKIKKNNRELSEDDWRVD